MAAGLLQPGLTEPVLFQMQNLRARSFQLQSLLRSLLLVTHLEQPYPPPWIVAPLTAADRLRQASDL